MGDNTFVDHLLDRSRTPALDEIDIDLLQMRCNDAEAQRDGALEERDDALEMLAKVRASLYEAIDEREQALQKVAEWREAAIAAHHLIKLASGEQLQD
ncbi:hypothetical protein K438DRAFT_1961923 [Mycena galopus ATCC 62051]|nr:hypothetical protein K438DRAFT_1982254 [Mycena galopus ATCC 62051]KAF8207664.1 hypothetical protein K438DRAFT_1961923 [Mycena galopus ATCC 62051]